MKYKPFKNYLFLFFGLLMNTHGACAYSTLGTKDSTKSNISGIWKGELSLDGFVLLLEFDIKYYGEDQYRSYLSVLQQGAKDIAMDKTLVNKRKIRISSALLGAEFEGTWDKKNTIKGQFKQNGNTLPLTLERGSIMINRPQTPKGPFPYTQKTATFSNGEGSCRFYGTLSSPKGIPSKGTVIMFSGSGAQNRDEEIMGHKPFAVLADTFTRIGFHVLRVDDRGAGLTQCNPKVLNYHTGDLIRDGNSYLKYVRDSVPDHGPLILFGHSEGARIIAALAVQNSDVQGLIAFGPALVLGSDINTFQNQQGLKKLLGDSQGVAHYLQLHQSILRISEQNATFSISKDSFHKLIQSRLGHWSKSVPVKASRNIQKKIKKATKQEFETYLTESYYPLFTNPWMFHFLHDDPLVDWLRVSCKTVLINGDLDVQTPVSLNEPVFTKFFMGKPFIRYKRLPEINHLFQKAKTGDVMEYGTIEESVDASVLHEMMLFLDSYR
jgi:uncharacterized protein